LSSAWRRCIALALVSTASFAQSADPDLDSLVNQLMSTIERMSNYRAASGPPPIFQVPQHVLEAKVCDQPCNVSAAYLPREGIFLAGNLDPMREPLDRAALLHELVHYFQQGLQNAYLADLGLSKRVTLYDGELDCAGQAKESAR
jgi:hypothetical protein